MEVGKIVLVKTKNCVKCNETKDIIFFNKHSGTKDKLDNRCKECVKKCKQKTIDNSEIKEYPVYELDINYQEWQVGKPTGSILYRIDPISNSERYEVRIPLGNGKCKSKSFNFNNYDNKEKAKKEANMWLLNYSKENNLTKNMIKVVDKKTILVKLTQDMIMITDIQFSDICQKYIICSTKSGSENSKYYASLLINNKLNYFHKYITGNNMTDHNNRNPLDNRLENLKKTTPKLNNNNRGSPKKYINNEFHMLGVRFIQKDESWQARIKQDNKEYTKSFSVKKYGYDEAKNMAIKARDEFNKQFNCMNTNTHQNCIELEDNLKI